jgi:hypothetical protein
MSLARSRLADQQQAGLLVAGVFASERFHREQHAGEAAIGWRVVGGKPEIVERRAAVEGRDAGPILEGVRAVDVAADATLGAGRAVALHYFPARTATVRTNRLRHLPF